MKNLRTLQTFVVCALISTIVIAIKKESLNFFMIATVAILAMGLLAWILIRWQDFMHDLNVLRTPDSPQKIRWGGTVVLFVIGFIAILVAIAVPTAFVLDYLIRTLS